MSVSWLHPDLSTHRVRAAPGRVYTTEACAPRERVYTTGAGPELHLDVSTVLHLGESGQSGQGNPVQQEPVVVV